jgi:hydrogenase-4 component B
MTSTILGLCCVATFLAAGGLGVMTSHWKHASTIVYTICLTASLTALGGALHQLLLAPAPSAIILPFGLPWLGAHFRMDPVSAVFLIIINLGAASASLYAIGYGAHEESPARVLPFYPAFLAGMNLVILADDAFIFLLSWEFMSLASWALVASHHRSPENVRAAYIYLLMASFGALLLLLAFGVLAGPEGGYAFDAIRNHKLSPELANLVLFLALFGAGSKAGLAPFHVWLPLAHPAAPSHVSALMSGVMTKVAVYAFIRIVFDLLGTPSWWWSLIVLTSGAAAAALGILYALMQADLKRVLAYSTIENIGVIFIALGLALAFKANGLNGGAALAMTTALLHAFNHSLFKSLLFFGAGAVLAATGERNMERLGGLIHRMPYTSFVFLVGCVAISALPPLNGFVSEWLAFQTILLSPQLPQWGLKLLIPAVGAVLALAAALAAGCFVRAFGVTFLGHARGEAAKTAHEVDKFSLAAMSILASLCLLAGVLPSYIMDAMAPAVHTLANGHMPMQADDSWLTIVPIAESRSSYNGLIVLFSIIWSASFAALLIHRYASRTVRRGSIWDCGFPSLTPQMQYTADSFSQPIRRVFGSIVFHAKESVDMPPPGDPRPARFSLELHDMIWETLYLPTVHAVELLAAKLNYLQFLSIRRYLSLVFFSLVSLLLVLALWP